MKARMRRSVYRGVDLVALGLWSCDVVELDVLLRVEKGKWGSNSCIVVKSATVCWSVSSVAACG